MILDKLRKIQALAERGTDGEKTNAKSLLTKLLKEHNLTPEDLTGRKDRVFVCTDKLQDDLLGQIVMSVLDCRSINYRKRGNKRVYELNEAEYLDVKSRYDWHKSNMKREFEATKKSFYSAYIHKHDLFPSSDPNEENKPLDYEELKRILSIMDSLGDNRFLKMID